jgi:hypothetical protein
MQWLNTDPEEATKAFGTGRPYGQHIGWPQLTSFSQLANSCISFGVRLNRSHNLMHSGFLSTESEMIQLRMSQPILTIGVTLMIWASPAVAQDASNEQGMINHCRQRHPEMSVDQCRSMYQNMKNMTPEQRVERCKRNHPELAAEVCQKKYGGST